MIGSRRVGDTKISAEERRSEFGYEFFHGVGVLAEPATEVTIKALFMTCPMRQFMKQCRVEALGRTARSRPREAFAFGHFNVVRFRQVARHFSAFADVGTSRLDEGFRLSQNFNRVRMG